jgi:hypothetical protein
VGETGPDPSPPRGWRPARRWWLPVGLAAVGIAVVLATSGTAAIVGWGIVASAVTVAISLVFLEVGYSEDRARARGEYGPVPPDPADRPPDR